MNKRKVPDEIQTLYLQLKASRKAKLEGEAADLVQLALEYAWPPLRNLSTKPTLTFWKAFGVALIGVVIGLILVGIFEFFVGG